MSDLSVEQQIVLCEISGKNQAIHAYDGILWKIRAGFITLVFVGWGTVLKGLVEHPAEQTGASVWGPMVTVTGGLAIAAFVVDWNYTQRKFRVVAALDAFLASLPRDGVASWTSNARGTTSELRGLMRVSGDTGDDSFRTAGYRRAKRVWIGIYVSPLIVIGVALVMALSLGARAGGASTPGHAHRAVAASARTLPSSAPAALRGATRYLGVSYTHEDVGTIAFAQLVRAYPSAVDVDVTPRASGGGLTTAYLFVVDRPLDVWRFQSDSGALGRWWALEEPPGTADHIRRDYAICRGWNHLDRLVHCKISPGVLIAAGLGNDVTCPQTVPEERYDRSPHWQVFVRAEPNDEQIRCDAATVPARNAAPASKGKRQDQRL